MSEQIERLGELVDRFAGALGSADPAQLEAPVAGCPGWDVRELATHLGGVHQWARHAMIAGDPKGVPTPPDEASETLAAWYHRHAGDLLATLRELGPDHPSWTFGEPRTAAFWQRRQRHETLIHLWDLRTALGLEAPIDADEAWDGIGEAVAVMVPRQIARGALELPHAIELRAVDLDQEAILVGEGDPVIASGTAEELLLALYHRRAPEHPDAGVALLLELPLVP